METLQEDYNWNPILAEPISHNSSYDTGIVALLKASHNNTPSNEATSIFGEDGFTFGDIIDIVNPLQHIPIISSIYRKISGDTIAPAMQIAGDALFGGPIGAAISIAKAVIKSQLSIDNTDQHETAVNPATIANNATQPLPRAINANDYLLASDFNNKQEIVAYQQTNKPVINQYGGSIGQAISAAALRNSVHKGAEKYAEVISSINTPVKNIDIIIGGNVDAS